MAPQVYGQPGDKAERLVCQALRCLLHECIVYAGPSWWFRTGSTTPTFVYHR